MSVPNKSYFDWDIHRNELQNCYLAEGWTLKEIMTHMENRHGFSATKAQYEIQFKKWDLRKNLTNEEWDYIHFCIRKRKREEKDSDVYFNRTKIPEKRIKKELSRRYPISYKDFRGIISTPKTPEAISISTPGPVSAYTIDLTDLPWFRFQSLMESTVIFTPKQPRSKSPESDGLTLPLEQVSHLASPRELTSASYTTLKDNGHALLLRFLEPTIAVNGHNPLSQFRSQMQVCYLERYEGELMEKFKRFVDPSLENSSIQSFEFFLYLLSNNLLSEAQKEGFLRWIIRKNHNGLLRSCLETQMPTVHALATKVLESALRIGDTAFLQLLIDSGVDTSSFHGVYGGRYLCIAANNGNTEIVQILLEHGADINAGADSEYGYTALQTAARHEDIALVKALVKAGADVNSPACPRYGSTALQAAAEKGNIALVEILIAAGADVNSPACPGHGSTALQAAAENGNIALVEILIDAGADVNAPACPESGYTALQAAAKQDNIALVERLIETGADVNAPACPTDGYTALQVAAGQGNMVLVKILINAGANVNAPACPEFGYTALQAAAKYGNTSLVEILIDAGADINTPACPESGYTALQAAAIQGSRALVEILIEVGADVNAPACPRYGYTALQAAAGQGNIALVKILIDAGADVNAPACLKRGYTALQAAARHGNIALVKTLIDADADINTPACPESGCTALQAAAEQENIPLVEILIEAGADVNAPACAESGYTALQAAAKYGNIALVEILTDADADVNAPACPCGGYTALQAAAEQGNLALVKNLIDAGADVNARGSLLLGKTAIQAAIECEKRDWPIERSQRIEIFRTLVGAGANLKHDTTILISAIMKGDIELVQAVLAAGANVNGLPEDTEIFSPLDAGANAAPCGEYGKTPIQSASSTENANMGLIEVLLEAGANINAPAAFKWGLTALQGAAICGHLNIALRFLELGADVNAAPAVIDGRTALDGAAEHGRLDMVQLLLKAGAEGDPSAENRFDRAVALARENGHFAVARLLQSY